jgi:mannose-1-phosphate guanylyltransferase
LASGDATLLEQSVRRIAPLVGDDVCVATTADLVAQTRSLLPGVLVFGEPARRNTLGALVWATAQLLARYPGEDVSVAVLTADHAISPDAAFLGTVSRALDIAEERGSLTTIGIKPTRPATEYGYIETGEEIGGSAWAAKRFTEKPKADTATEFLRSGRFLWNSGMFFWTVGSFVEELRRAVPEAASALDGIARALGEGDEPAAVARFADVPSISIDYALMERAENVAVVASDFEWDDLGSWDALSRSLPADEHGNVGVGRSRMVDSAGCVVYNSGDGVRVTLLGLDDVVVAVSEGEVLVCKKDRAQDVRGLAD